MACGVYSLHCFHLTIPCILSFQLEVEDLKHRKVKLRCMMVGQKVKKQVKLINRSPIDVSFTLLVTNTLLDPKVGIALAHTLTHTHS